tara:strand:- start:5490 stop:6035 length:546 start_codon:yes stop_codon:yes gene_type:complete
MYIQTEKTPNPNSLKFIPGKIVSNAGSFEVLKKDDVSNSLIRNLLSINGILSIFLAKDFISISKDNETSWEDIKHIAISLINEYYISGKELVVDKSLNDNSIDESRPEIEKKIIELLNTKVKPAVERDGGDIKFKEFKNGIVKVELKGSCSGCPSSTMTLKNGVQNLLSHYIPEVKSVEAI